MSDRELAVALRISTKKLGKTLTLFREKKFVAEDMRTITNWRKRQFRSDLSTDRVRKYRAMKRFGNVSETPPDTDTDTDTENIYTPPIYIPPKHETFQKPRHCAEDYGAPEKQVVAAAYFYLRGYEPPADRIEEAECNYARQAVASGRLDPSNPSGAFGEFMHRHTFKSVESLLRGIAENQYAPGDGALTETPDEAAERILKGGT